MSAYTLPRQPEQHFVNVEWSTDGTRHGWVASCECGWFAPEIHTDLRLAEADTALHPGASAGRATAAAGAGDG